MMSDESIELPEGWEIANLSDIVEILDSKRIPLNSDERAKRKGEYSYYGANGKVDTIDNYLFDGSYVLIAEDGGYFDNPLKAVAYAVCGKFWVNNHAHIVQGLDDIESEFLVYVLNQVDWMKYVSGTTRLKLTQAALKSIALPLPPIAEQKRIVAKIEELRSRTQKAREALEIIPKLCDRFRQSVLAAAFRGDLTADWRKENPDVEPAEVLIDKSNGTQPQLLEHLKLFDIPDTWLWSKVREIGTVSGGLTKNSKRDELPLEFPYLRVANVYFNQLDLSEIKTIRITESEYKRVLLKEGDLLVVEGNGSLDQIGRVALWDGSITPCLHQNHLIKVRFHFVSVGIYVLYWLLSKQGRDSITTIASSTSGLHTLSLSKVASLPVPVAPQQEQAEIVSQIQKLFQIIDRIQQQYEAAKVQLEKLNRAILAKAFRGELVPQDPNDEPASVLLDRIREERTKISNQPSKRKR